MPFYKKYPYMNEDNGDGGQNGGGENPQDKQPQDNQTNNGGQQTNETFTETEARLLKENMQKKDQIKKLNEQLKSANDRLSQFDGIDPEAIKKMLEEKKASEQAEMERKGEYDRLKAQMVEEHNKELAVLQKQVSEANEAASALKSQIANLTVGNAFGNSRYISENTILTVSHARKLYGDYFEYTDGVVVGYDKPVGEKDRTMLVNASGNPLSFNEALKKIIEADPGKNSILRSKTIPGAGSGTTPKPSSKSSSEKYLSRADKIAQGLREQSEE